MQWLRLPVRCARLGGWFALAFGGRGLGSLKTLVIWRSCAALALAACAIGAQAADYQYVYDELGRVVGVVAPDGSSVSYAYDAVGNITAIKNFAANAIAVSEFTPNSGPVGTVVTIHGSGFSATPASNTVKFNGVTATVSAATANRLTVAVPAGATTGSLTVTSPNGSVTAGTFTVAVGQVPTITAFTPTMGPTGTVVTVNGTNFQLAKEDNRVQFGANYTAAKTAAATSLTAAVPVSAGSGKISVSTPFGKAVSSGDFYAVPQPLTTANIGYTGRLTLGTAQTVTFPTSGKRALLIFDALPYQYFSLVGSGATLTGPIDAQLFNPDGSLVGNINVAPNDSVALPTLKQAGTYSLVVAAYGNETGNVVLKLVADQGGPLPIGSTPVSLAAGQAGRYTFTGQPGKGYGVAVTGLTFGGTGSGPKSVSVELIDTDGVVVSTCNFAASDRCVLRPAFFTKPGTYTVRFDPWSSYSASFNAVFSEDASGVLVPDAAPSAVTIAREGQAAMYSFNAVAGQDLSLLITNHAIGDGNAATQTTTYFYVILPSQQPAKYAYWWSIPLATTENRLALDMTGLPETGTYTIGVYPERLDKGSFSLQLKKELTGTLTVDASKALSFQAGQNGRYTFNAQAGKGYGLALENLTLGGTGTEPRGVLVELRNPSNAVLTTCYHTVSNRCTFAPSFFTVAGTYSLRFMPSAFYTASFNAILSQDVAGTLAIDAAAPTTVTIPRAGQAAVYTFSGTAGQKLNLVMTDIAFDDGNATTPLAGAQVYIYRPSQLPVSSWYWLTLGLNNGVGTVMDYVELPETGTYAIGVYPNAMEKGAVKLHLKRHASGTLAVNGATPISLSAGQTGNYSFTGQAGKGYTLAITNPVFGSPGTPGMRIRLLSPTGAPIEYCGATVDAKCLFRPYLFTTTGTYTVEFDQFDVSSVTFNAALGQDVGGSLTVDAASSTPVTIAHPGQAAVYTFAGTAGQNLKLHITGNTMDDGKPATTYNTYFYVFRPGDQPIGYGYWLTTNVPTNGGAAVLDMPNLPATGTYAIGVYPTELDKGTVNLQVKKAP